MDCGTSRSRQPAKPLPVLAHQRNRHEGREARTDPHRAGTGPAAAVRRREGFVQIHVNDVETHVARANLAENGVQIRAVVVQEPARVVNDARDLLDSVLEHAQGGRIGEHDRGRFMAYRRLQRVDVDIAVPIARNLGDAAAAHRGGGGIRAVRGLRHDDLATSRIIALSMIGPDHRHARELALRAGHGRETDPLHAGDVLEHLLQLVHAGEKSLGSGASGWRPRNSGNMAYALQALGLYFMVQEPKG